MTTTTATIASRLHAIRAWWTRDLLETYNRINREMGWA